MIENNNDSGDQLSEKVAEDEAQKQNTTTDWSSGINVEDITELLGDVVEIVGDLVSNIDVNI